MDPIAAALTMALIAAVLATASLEAALLPVATLGASLRQGSLIISAACPDAPALAHLGDRVILEILNYGVGSVFHPGLIKGGWPVCLL